MRAREHPPDPGDHLSLSSATHPLSYHTAQYVIATCSAGPIGSSAQAHHHLDRSTITQPHTRDRRRRAIILTTSRNTPRSDNGPDTLAHMYRRQRVKESADIIESTV